MYSRIKPFCCAVTLILLPVSLVAYLKCVMFATATFLPRTSACAVESRPFRLMSDTGPVWHSVTVERPQVYFWTFSASSVNFVWLITLWLYRSASRDKHLSLSTALWDSYVSPWCCTMPSVLWLVRCYEMWHKLFGCHLNYLYTPLLDVKIGLLCSAAQQIFHSLRIKLNNMRMLWK